ncbi:ABC transporter permease subunit [bacterium NHP-B]|nr:ABC transporter permease subunit [bacterium NHP-B]
MFDYVRKRSAFLIFMVPYVWLSAFLLVPLIVIFCISFSESLIAIPPFAPMISWVGRHVMQIKISFDNYAFILSDPLYILSYLNSFGLAFATTLLCLVSSYPVAYGLFLLPKRTRFFCLMLLLLPFWISFLVRVYAWIGLLDAQGFLSLLLQKLGLFHSTEGVLGTPVAVLLGMVYTYLPFMILPLYNALEKIDFHLVEAASDLGAKPLAIFWKIIFPLSRRGALAGSILVLIPVVGEFVVPELLGGGKVLMIGQMIWNEFFYSRDWPLASALAMLMLVTLVPPIMILQRLQKKL